MSWEKVKLGELYTVHNGLSKGRQFFGSGFPFLSFSTVFNNYFIPSELSDLVQSTEKEQQDYSICRGDVFITRTSETSNELGMSCVALKDYPCATYNGFTKRMRPVNYKRVFPEYIGYYLRMPSFRSEFQAFSTMTTRASLRNEDLLGLEVVLPPMEIQQRIADILAAYDELIENNQKQVKLLEEAAQRLYKEWFVDLRFPGYENTPIIDGIPQGWKKLPLGELIEYEIGGGWGEDQPTEKCDLPAYVIRGTDLYDVTHGNAKSIPYRFHAKSNLDSRKLQDGDIVFEVSGGSKNEGVARTALITESLLDFLGGDVICASFCKLIRFEDKSLAKYMYDTFQYLRNSGETVKYDKRSASSIVNYRWKDFLEQQFIFVPTVDILTQYNALAENMQNAIVNKAQIIEQAKQARDRLLPKLMSGELEV
jgi:type I restriction enzyme S subunit